LSEAGFSLLLVLKYKYYFRHKTQLPVTSKIYSENQISVIALLGNPLIAGYLVASNFRKFNKPQRVIETWLFTGLLTIAFIILAIVDPKMAKGFGFFLPFLNASLVRRFTRTYQQKRIKDHKDHGVEFYGWGRILLILVIGLVITIAMGIAISYFINRFVPPPPYSTR